MTRINQLIKFGKNRQTSKLANSSTYNKYSKTITESSVSGAAQAMLYSLGLTKNDLSKPQVGIGAVAYASNPCNSKLGQVSSRVQQSVDSVGLLSFPFSTVGVSDGISMGTTGMNYSLPSRDHIADSFEMICGAHHYDAVVAIPGCDKNLPGVAQALFTLNRPGFIIYGGAMPPSKYQGKDLDIVSAFESYGQLISGEIGQGEYDNIIRNACNRDCGSCSGLYTANTMAAILEVMGLTLPNSSSNPSQSKEKESEIVRSGEIIKNLIYNDIKPLDIVTRESFLNAIKMLYITGGSTNAIIHLLAMANTANIELSLQDFSDFEDLPVLLNMKPHGKFMMYHLHKIGGMSLLIKYLIENDVIDGSLPTVTGSSLAENVEGADLKDIDHDIIYPLSWPFRTSSHIKILKGNIAPMGCVSKITSGEKVFMGEIRVFDCGDDMIMALHAGEITSENFIIIRYQGESVGCPEMLRPTSALAGYFGKGNTPPLATDGRFSGGSHGTLVCHLEDAYKEGSVTALMQDGDIILMNLHINTITLEVPSNIVDERRKKHTQRVPELTGFLAKFSRNVGDIRSGYHTYLPFGKR
jgi:dihydroxy-acid dehydratase